MLVLVAGMGSVTVAGMRSLVWARDDVAYRFVTVGAWAVMI